jgi:hypothetical protein
VTGERAMVYCTAHIDSDPDRYADWAGYYGRFFAGRDVDLVLVNDGPALAPPALGGAEVVTLRPALGRPGPWCSPGCKRSIAHGLWLARRRGYRWVGFLESDCYVLPAGRAEYLHRLRSYGHGMGYCRTYDFPEVSLQTVNDIRPIEAVLAWYATPEGWYAVEDFERRMAGLGAGKILEGDRHEGADGRVWPGDTYVAQVTLSTLRARFPHLLEGA